MNMTNNDILIRLRYALDLKNTEMVEIFKLGGVDITKEDVLKLLVRPNEDYLEEAGNEVNDEDIIL